MDAGSLERAARPDRFSSSRVTASYRDPLTPSQGFRPTTFTAGTGSAYTEPSPTPEAAFSSKRLCGAPAPPKRIGAPRLNREGRGRPCTNSAPRQRLPWTTLTASFRSPHPLAVRSPVDHLTHRRRPASRRRLLGSSTFRIGSASAGPSNGGAPALEAGSFRPGAGRARLRSRALATRSGPRPGGAFNDLRGSAFLAHVSRLVLARRSHIVCRRQRQEKNLFE